MLKPAAHHRNGDEQNRRDNEGVQGEETHGLRFIIDLSLWIGIYNLSFNGQNGQWRATRLTD